MEQAPFNEKNLAYVVERYSNDIAGFAVDLLGFERFDPWQNWLFEQMLTTDVRRVAIASCHSSGKTLNACVIALHRLICYPEARVLITSATEGQLKAAFVTTLHAMVDKSLIKDWFNVSREEITLKGNKEAWIRLRAWSEHRPESFAGVHCKSPMFIFDEASGISQKIYEAVSGSMMHPYSKILLLGNPLHKTGELWDAFNSKKNSYVSVHVSAHDSTFISKEWIEDMKDTYGENSDIYRVRVLGLFPQSDIETFINDGLIRDAVDREVSVAKMEPILAGLDIGRFHDASVLCVRQGHKVLSIEQIRSRDLMTVAELVSRSIIKYKIDKVCVDENGIGAGVGDRLRQIHTDKIFPVKLGNYSFERSKEYYNGRAELWGKAKAWLKYGSIPYNKDLINEGSSLLFSFDAHGRYQLERKKDAVKRGVSSPDFFDAFAYTFGCNTIAQPVTKSVTPEDVDFSWY